jgi:hypothetical protein
MILVCATISLFVSYSTLDASVLRATTYLYFRPGRHDSYRQLRSPIHKTSARASAAKHEAY